MTHTPELAAALEHEGALRRLAWMLHLGGADADDAVQHALTQVALGKRPAGMPLWTFLRTALKRHAFNLRKLARRRRARELAVAHGEVALPVDEMVAREQLRHRVAQAVIALAEPYRTTVWLRWFEGLDVDGVAAHMQVPGNTVRTRLQRAHLQLKVRLDHEYGDGRWGAFAVPIGLLAAGSGSPLPLLAIAGFAASLLCVASLAIGRSLRDADPTPVELVASTVAVDDSSRAPVVASAPTAVFVPRAPTPARERDDRAFRVLTAERRPMAGVAVWWWGAGELPSALAWWPRAKVGPRPCEVGDEDFELPSTLLRTDGAGRVAIPSPRPVAITVQLTEQLWFSTALPDEGPVVVPVLATVAFTLLGAATEVAWEARVRVEKSAGVEAARLSTALLDLETPSGSGGVRLHSRWQSMVGRGPLQILVPNGPWGWTAEGKAHGYAIANPPECKDAPCEIDLSLGPRVPICEFAVLEPDGRRSARAGIARLRDGTGAGSAVHLANGMARFDTRDHGLSPIVRVRMADGADLVVTAAFGVDRPRVDALRLSGATPPLRVVAEGLRVADLFGVFVEQRTGWLRASAYGRLDRAADIEFGASRDGLWIAGVAPPAATRICLVTKTGRTAFGAVDARGQVRAAWLPGAPATDVRLADLSRAVGSHRSLLVKLELGLPTPGGETTWVVLRSHHLMPPTAALGAPVWKDQTMPNQLPWRLRVYGGDAAGAPVLLERTTLR